MTVLNEKYVSTVEASGVARSVFEEATSKLPLTPWLPSVSEHAFTYEFAQGGKKLVDLASYRAYDAAPETGRRFGDVTYTGRIPALSRELPLSEISYLESSGKTETIRRKILDDVESLALGIAFRLELAKIEAIRTGKLLLTENGLNAEIDYGRHTDLTVDITTATKKWNHANATPLTDVLNWVTLVTQHGRTPSVALLTLDVLELLAKNAEFIAAHVERGSADLPTRISQDAVRAVFAQNGIYDVIVVNQAYSGFDLGEAPFPAGTFILLPSAGASLQGGSLGRTLLGVTAEGADSLAESEQPGLFGATYERSKPVGFDTLVTALALPLLESANSTLSAKVI